MGIVLRGSVLFFNEYDIYHDESLIGGFWHGDLSYLAIPVSTCFASSHECAKTPRVSTRFAENVNKGSGKLHKCVGCWLQIAVALVQDFKRKPCFIATGADGRSAEYTSLSDVIGARFVLFKVRGGLQTLSLGSDYGSKVETTFWNGFQGRNNHVWS